MSEPTHDPELDALQTALARLAPAPDGIHLGRLLFRAGQASARRGWAWPGATAASALLAAALGAALLLRPAPQSVERLVTVYVDRPTQARSASAGTTPTAPPAAPADADRGSEDADALRLRQAVLAHGVDALPPSAPWPAAARPRAADSLLDLPPDDAREPWLQRLKNSLRSGDAS